MPDALADDADADNASEHWEVAAVLAGGGVAWMNWLIALGDQL